MLSVLHRSRLRCRLLHRSDRRPIPSSPSIPRLPTLPLCRPNPTRRPSHSRRLSRQRRSLLPSILRCLQPLRFLPTRFPRCHRPARHLQRRQRRSIPPCPSLRTNPRPQPSSRLPCRARSRRTRWRTMTPSNRRTRAPRRLHARFLGTGSPPASRQAITPSQGRVRASDSGWFRCAALGSAWLHARLLRFCLEPWPIAFPLLNSHGRKKGRHSEILITSARAATVRRCVFPCRSDHFLACISRGICALFGSLDVDMKLSDF